MRRCPMSLVAVLVTTSLATTIQAQPLTPDPVFMVNTYTTGKQERAVASPAGDDGFVLVWESEGQDGSGEGIVGRGFDSIGIPLAGEVLINVTTDGDQERPDIASDADRNFTIVYQSENFDGDGDGIVARRFFDDFVLDDSAFNELQVNSATSGNQTAPAIAVYEDGRFIVTWESDSIDGDGKGIAARLFNIDGTPLGDDFQVNQFTAGTQNDPDVSIDLVSGIATIVWSSFGQDGDGPGVVARRFEPFGDPVIDEFIVNTYTTFTQFEPTIAVAGDGSFTVLWTDGSRDGELGSVWMQQFDRNAVRIGTEIRVNLEIAGNQSSPSFAYVGPATIPVDTSAGEIYGVGLPQVYGAVAFQGANGFKTGIYNNMLVDRSPVGESYALSGFEVLGTPENFFYSHARTMFYGEPFSHTGILASADRSESGGSTGDDRNVYGYILGWTVPGEPCGDTPVGGLTTGPTIAATIAPAADERVITASDALVILRTAVGLLDCVLCICDVDSSGAITATDALAVLRNSVGLSGDLNCPACT